VVEVVGVEVGVVGVEVAVVGVVISEDLCYGPALNLPSAWDSLDPVLGCGCDTQVHQQSLKSINRDSSLNSMVLALIYITVQLLALRVTQGIVLLIIVISIILSLLLLRLHSRAVLSLWALRHHNLYLKRLLLLRYKLG
jgi:hypothetical protein